MSLANGALAYCDRYFRLMRDCPDFRGCKKRLKGDLWSTGDVRKKLRNNTTINTRAGPPYQMPRCPTMIIGARRNNEAISK